MRQANLLPIETFDRVPCRCSGVGDCIPGPLAIMVQCVTSTQHMKTGSGVLSRESFRIHSGKEACSLVGYFYAKKLVLGMFLQRNDCWRAISIMRIASLS